ncbi:MAG: hypothetical protein UR79_C0002G0070 [Candidatus Campbellbacteria bacterium GW2011_GWD1_35_49]|nr:MAG: hypothetical protein UR74_C0002G0263 [Candidatus Campbellbacteria bacterium GW2011_GWD2_35_24]KKP75883.1 MAG: hypothetical protein UR75_C0002G0264 [Candidatus Campbellbacteria bacterium GW2011_GWC2_35_28]KKP76869.1 MAG: hypothetical protein UR76_C0002G0070 [Candidatus Campbellbacteria bacterium GW2011_GWC1_35_31]KKP78795.1 MAG: hypothetical protein UR79_C0002G0070 [Candidatus Campbellbacteria bacterium GW2011_GWD1_35_49]
MFPAMALAAAPTSLQDLIGRFQEIINMLVPLAMGLAVLAFIWGLVVYIYNGSNPAKRSEGYMFMVYGIIALFVMTTMWGLVAILNGTILGA